MACCQGIKPANRKVLFLMLFCFSLAVRLIVFFGISNKNNNCLMYPDSVQYNQTAQQLFAGNGFKNEQGQPQLYRLPGYPLFLAYLYKIKGDTNIVFPLLVQIVLASFIPVLLVTFVSMLFPSCMCLSWCAGMWAAVHPGLVLYAGMVTTESLFLFFFLLFLLFFLPFITLSFRRLSRSLILSATPCSSIHCALAKATADIQNEQGVVSKDEAQGHAFGTSKHTFFIAGLFLGIASLVRPVGLYLLVLSSVLLLVSIGTLWQRLQRFFILSSGWLMVVAWWLVRNFMLTGAFFFHTLPGHHFLQYMAGYTLVEQEKKEFDIIRPRLLHEWEEAIKKEEIKNGAPSNDWQRCRIAEKIAWNYIKMYPLAACKVAVTQMAKTCFSLYSAQPLLSDSATWPAYTSRTRLWTKIKRFLRPPTKNGALLFFIYFELFMHLLLWLGIFLFFISVWRRKDEWAFVSKTLPFIGLFIFLTLAYGCARLRLPIEPFLILYACKGWLWMCCPPCAKNDGC